MKFRAAQPHGWRDCQPALMALGRATTLTGVRGLDAQRRTWDRLDDADRAAHHRYTCLGRKDSLHRTVIRNLTRQYEAELGIYDMQDLTMEFGLPMWVNDNTELLTELMGVLPLGLPLQPTTAADLKGRAGVQISVRVRDLEFEKFTVALSKRIQVVPCAECLMECWHDPLAVIDPTNNTVLCIACCRWRLHLGRSGR